MWEYKPMRQSFGAIRAELSGNVRFQPWLQNTDVATMWNSQALYMLLRKFSQTGYEESCVSASDVLFGGIWFYSGNVIINLLLRLACVQSVVLRTYITTLCRMHDTMPFVSSLSWLVGSKAKPKWKHDFWKVLRDYFRAGRCAWWHVRVPLQQQTALVVSGLGVSVCMNTSLLPFCCQVSINRRAFIVAAFAYVLQTIFFYCSNFLSDYATLVTFYAYYNTNTTGMAQMFALLNDSIIWSMKKVVR